MTIETRLGISGPSLQNGIASRRKEVRLTAVILLQLGKFLFQLPIFSVLVVVLLTVRARLGRRIDTV